jgi:hypothetical protein
MDPTCDAVRRAGTDGVNVVIWAFMDIVSLGYLLQTEDIQPMQQCVGKLLRISISRLFGTIDDRQIRLRRCCSSLALVRGQGSHLDPKSLCG